MTPDHSSIVAAGLFDRDWVGAQLATAFATDDDALARFLDPATDCSPHPLFEEGWAGCSLHRLPHRPAGAVEGLAASARRRGQDRGRAAEVRPPPARTAGLVAGQGARGHARTCAGRRTRDHLGTAARRGARGRRATRGSGRSATGPATYPTRCPRPRPKPPRWPRPARSRSSPSCSWCTTTGDGCGRWSTRCRPRRTPGGSSSWSTTGPPTTRPRCSPAWRRTSRGSCR